MALDMYMGAFCRNILRFGFRVEKIHSAERDEIYRSVRDRGEEFPALQELSEQFWDGPIFEPLHCKVLADELQALKLLVNDPDLPASIDRIRTFFLLAHEKKQTVYCHSD